MTTTGISAGSSDLDGLFEAVPDIVYRYRFLPEPGFDFVSASVSEITGYSPEEHYADPQLGLKIVHPDDIALVQDAIENPAEGRTYRIRWRARDGREFVTEQRLRRVVDEDGRLVAIIGVCRPVDGADRAWMHEAGDVMLDLAGGRAFVAGRPLALTSAEHRILSRLASTEATVTRRELVETLWGSYHASGERAVEVHISKLRRKLEQDPSRPRRLLTERGVGYRLSRVAG
jgi:PAS domain S-box-containing protein